MPVDPQVKKDLEGVVGADNVITDPGIIFTEIYDAWLQIIPGKPIKFPDYIVKPANEMEVAEVMKIANKYKIPVHPCTGYTYKLPLAGGILLQLTRMTRIHEVNVEEMYAVIDAGVTFNQFFRYTRARGLNVMIPYATFPPHVSIVANYLFKGIGSNIIPISDGNQEALMALEVVLPTGEIVHTGSWSQPNSSCKYTFDLGWGPQLTRIFVGALGTLGVVTKAAIKMWPAPKAVTTKILAHDDVEGMCRSMRELALNKIFPATTGGHWLLAVLHGPDRAPYWGFEHRKKLYELTDEDITKMREYYGFPGKGPHCYYCLAIAPHWVSEDEAKVTEKAFEEYLKKRPDVKVLDPEVGGGRFCRLELSVKADGALSGDPTQIRTRYVGWTPGLIWSFYGSIGWSTFAKMHEITWSVGRKCGLVPALHTLSINEGRAAHVRYMVPIERGDPKGLDSYAKFVGEVIPRVIKEAGFTPARCFGLGAQTVSSIVDPGFAELYRKIKRALDPNNIMSPALAFNLM